MIKVLSGKSVKFQLKRLGTITLATAGNASFSLDGEAIASSHSGTKTYGPYAAGGKVVLTATAGDLEYQVKDVRASVKPVMQQGDKLVNSEGLEVSSVGNGNNDGVLRGLALNDSTAGALTKNAELLMNACAAGGRITLPPGTIWHNPFDVTGAVQLIGQGSGDPYGPQTIGADTIDINAFGSAAVSVLQSKHNTGAGLTIRRPGVKLEGIKFRNDVQGGADQWLVFAGPDDQVGNRTDGLKVSQCVFKGARNQLKVGSSLGYSVLDNGFLDPFGGQSLEIENYMNADEGDPIIAHNTFNAYSMSAESAIRIRKGGGVKILGNKINRQPGNQGTIRRYRRGIDVDCNGFTSVMPITGNSIENVVQAGVRVSSETDGGYNNVVVTGNEFFSCGSTGLEGSVHIAGRAAYPLSGIMIGSNVFDSCNGIILSNVKSCAVGKNQWRKSGGDGLVSLINTCESVDVEPQAYGEISADTTLFRDSSFGTSQGLERGNRRHVYSRMLNLTTKDTWTNLFRFDTELYQLSHLHVRAIGSASGVGAAALTMGRWLTRDGGNVIPLISSSDAAVNTSAGTQNTTAPTSAAETVTGQDLALQLVVAGSNVTLQAKVPSGSAATSSGGRFFTGTIWIELEGIIARIVHLI